VLLHELERIAEEHLAGIMEITYWPKERRLWADIHDNGRTEWNVRMQPLFAEALEEAFHA